MSLQVVTAAEAAASGIPPMDYVVAVMGLLGGLGVLLYGFFRNPSKSSPTISSEDGSAKLRERAVSLASG